MAAQETNLDSQMQMLLLTICLQDKYCSEMPHTQIFREGIKEKRKKKLQCSNQGQMKVVSSSGKMFWQHKKQTYPDSQI